MDENKLSQITLILSYLKTYGSITAVQAQRTPICCYRLAARIADIRKAGIPVKSELLYKVSPVTGRKVRYAKYSLEGLDEN